MSNYPSIIVRNASDKPALTFHGSPLNSIFKGAYFGIEYEFCGTPLVGEELEEYVECDCNCPHCYDNGEWVTYYVDPTVSPYCLSESVCQSFDDWTERFVSFCHDGSISGHEANFMPMTYEFIVQNRAKFDRFLEFTRREGVNDQEDENMNAGMHVHISIEAFEDDEHLKRFVQLWTKHYRFAYRLANRDSDSYCYNVPISSDLESGEFREAYYENRRHRVKFQVVNTSHSRTAEVRIFKAPDTIERFVAYVELCGLFVHMTRDVTNRDLRKISVEDIIDEARALGLSDLVSILT